MVRYYTNIFSPKTWRIFQEEGANTTAFPLSREPYARKIQPGDIFICYLGEGISRFVGYIEVLSHYRIEDDNIFGQGVFPITFQVKSIVILNGDKSIPVLKILPKAKREQSIKNAKYLSSIAEGSLTEFEPTDAKILIEKMKWVENSLSSDIDLHNEPVVSSTKTPIEKGEIMSASDLAEVYRKKLEALAIIKNNVSEKIYAKTEQKLVDEYLKSAVNEPNNLV
jgi:hypothetical protein